MILTLDVGNTRIKGAVFELNTILETFVFEKSALQNKLLIILKSYAEVTDLVVSSVSDIEKNNFTNFSQTLNIHFVSHKDSFPFVNKYQTPQTLGVDRLVLAAGATLVYPNQNRLIIDAGTCVTYDFVDSNDNYLGGAISPGLGLRYKALNDFTAKLPLLPIKSPNSFIGNSTPEAIHSGVVNGLVYEIDRFIAEYEEKYSNFIIILTGGDADFLANRLKNTIFANSNFLLESLYQTFQYNHKNE
jgi:type III pantothenate kinase